jgi:4'-phosphopantetheinyl transferase
MPASRRPPNFCENSPVEIRSDAGVMNEPLSCPADEVHWLLCQLDEAARALPIDALSSDELERAARLQRALDRQRFVAARAWLRHVLGRYLAAAPRAVVFAQGQFGKPSLAGARGALQFNLSHSGGVALLALSPAAVLGADIEAVLPIDDCAAIARRHFAPAEWQRWSSLQPAQQLAAFYACWTRKEAYVKALGGGLSVPLDDFEVTFEPDRPAVLLSVGGSAQQARAWTLWGLQPTPGHVAAVAAHADGLKVRHVDWH